MNASSASSSSGVGSRKSTSGTRFSVLVKCWITAPVAKERSNRSGGAPSPYQPVCGAYAVATELRSASTCGTPRYEAAGQGVETVHSRELARIRGGFAA